MGRSTDAPPLKFERREKKKITIKELDSEVAEMIELYPAFYKESTGDAAPTIEEVIEQAVRKSLGGHAGFKKFREARRSSGGAAGGGGGGKTDGAK